MKRRSILVATSMIAMLALSASALATTLLVPKYYPTIQEAINASYDGDTILVSPGTYTEGINFGSREITVRSTKGAEVTIIDPPSGRCFTAVGQETPDAILEGFTLTGGSDSTKGGGVYISESSPTLIDCVITGNAQTSTSSSGGSGGGGVYVDSNSNPTMVRCVVSNNTSRSNGGGIHVRSSMTLTNCEITDNDVNNFGSHYYYVRGGGLYVGSSGVTITGGVISDNTSQGEGGGIYGELSISISDCLITGNVTSLDGGGLHRVRGQLTNCQIIGNVAQGNGGGLWADGSLGLTGCSIEENDAGGYGGAMYVDGSTSTFEDCQVRLNSAAQCGGVWIESGTLNTGGTLFCGNGVNISGNWQDLGDNIFQGKCDGSGPTTRLVPFEYATIQAAIDACFDGDEVLVAPGTYPESINYGGRAIAVRGVNGAEVTIIHPPSGRCFTAVGQETPDAILEGFTLTGGSDSTKGGGVYISESSPTLIDCVITGNAQTSTSSSGGSGGGGVYVDSNSNPTMVRCVVSNNTSRSNGGGIHVRSSMTLTNCEITDNDVNNFGSHYYYVRGGGLYVGSSGVTITGGVISDNTSQGEGGGIYGELSISISDCLITGNVTSLDGGGLHRVRGQLTNCQIIGNVAQGNGGGLWADGSLGLTGCSIEENDAGGYGGAMYVDGSTSTFEDCQVRLNSAAQCGGVWIESGTLNTGGTLFCGNGANICGNWNDQEDNIIQGQCDPFCIGDVNGDTWVNGEDLGRFLAAWGPCPSDEPCYADFDGSGVVDGKDFGLLLIGWGRCPGWD